MKVDLPLPLAPMIATRKFASVDFNAYTHAACTRVLAQFVVLVRLPYDDCACRKGGSRGFDLLTAGIVSSNSQMRFRRRGAMPRSEVLGATDRIMTSSPSFSSPSRTERIPLHTPRIRIPRETFTGRSTVLSAWSRKPRRSCPRCAGQIRGSGASRFPPPAAAE